MFTIRGTLINRKKGLPAKMVLRTLRTLENLSLIERDWFAGPLMLTPD